MLKRSFNAYAACAIRTDGTIITWGRNRYGGGGPNGAAVNGYEHKDVKRTSVHVINATGIASTQNDFVVLYDGGKVTLFGMTMKTSAHANNSWDWTESDTTPVSKVFANRGSFAFQLSDNKVRFAGNSTAGGKNEYDSNNVRGAWTAGTFDASASQIVPVVGHQHPGFVIVDDQGGATIHSSLLTQAWDDINSNNGAPVTNVARVHVGFVHSDQFCFMFIKDDGSLQLLGKYKSPFESSFYPYGILFDAYYGLRQTDPKSSAALPGTGFAAGEARWTFDAG